MRAPLCSVIIANFNGEAYLEQTIRSVLSQTLADVEIIVSDDGSTDGSLGVLTRLAETEPRLTVVEGAGNGGPAVARNRALDRARGRWVAVLDSDDLMHPDRLEVLVRFAEGRGLDLVADGFVSFSSEPDARPWLALGPDFPFPGRELDAVAYMRTSWDYPLGYLKPLFRRDALAATRYDETLIVGEDFDLVLRLLLEGRHFAILPFPLYLYRRHGQSISHRFSVRKLTPLIAANEMLLARVRQANGSTPALEAEFARRQRALKSALSEEIVFEAIRAGRLDRALAEIVRSPHTGFALAKPVSGLAKKLARRFKPGPNPAPLQVVHLLGDEGRTHSHARTLGLDGGGAGPVASLDTDLVGMAHRSAPDFLPALVEEQQALGRWLEAVVNAVQAGQQPGAGAVVYDDDGYQFLFPYFEAARRDQSLHYARTPP
ncbi:MAG: glycosyltransferase family 2 protein [Alsobacter sp.]